MEKAEMRSHITKTGSKKGSPTKTSVKGNSPTKVTKKKSLVPKTSKNSSVCKTAKKIKKVDKEEQNNESHDSNEDTYKDSGTDTATAGPSKETEKPEHSNKKSKKEPKEKKDKAKASDTLKSKIKKSPKILKKKVASKKKTYEDEEENDKDDEDDIKYKINLDAITKGTSRLSKGKSLVKKKSSLTSKKKPITATKITIGDLTSKEENLVLNNQDKNKDDHVVEPQKINTESVNSKKNDSKESSKEPKLDKLYLLSSPTSCQPETPKLESERPPKFFTSSRSSRTVDIDVKCLKTSKGNLSISERLSLKFESKNEENREKSISNTLISQGPDIDVYTFTEKVDSPKNILSDFRSPSIKNVGRVRPIARVKGTVIDKKPDTEKKKYSPHRPIEEVVKQLKASKQSAEQDPTTVVSALSPYNAIEKDDEEKPKQIVSKSYKMVARKSSVTGKPFSPIKFDTDQSESINSELPKKISPKKSISKGKRQQSRSISDDEFDKCKFSFNTKNTQYTSSDESVSESNDDNDSKESSESDSSKSKRTKNKKYKRITDSAKKTTSKELKELSKDSLIDLKEASAILGEKPSKRRLKLVSMWSGPKKHRMASLNAIAKVHCLYENESRTHMELGLMKTVDREILPSTSKAATAKKKETRPKKEESDQGETTSESEYENTRTKKEDSSESSDDSPPQRTLRGVPGIRSAGKYWDPKSCSSSSEDSEHESKKRVVAEKKKAPKKAAKSDAKTDSDSDKPSPKMKKTAGVPVKKKRVRNEVVMDLKDMVVQKRMASLNATAILAASYEKRSPKSNRDDTTSDSCSDESFSHKSKNGIGPGVKSDIKKEEIISTAITKKEVEESAMTDTKQKLEVIVNQESDVTITGVYSTHHHEGFCTVSGMQYRISSTSHTQTTATANCEKDGSSREEVSRYTPLSALSSMQPPPDHVHPHPHPVSELGGLARRAAGCSSAFSAPSPSAHHDPGKPEAQCICSYCKQLPYRSPYGYYQPAGPLIKETGEAERALARYHPPPHYHAPHPPMIQQYGPPYYPPDLCYGRYYRPPGPYHMPPPQPDAQMVGVGSEPYSPQYYGTPPCYQHSPQRIPYVEYRTCPCPLNACPKNVVIGPATGKAPAGSGPDVSPALAPPGGSYRGHRDPADTHGSGKDPPLEAEPPAAADAPHLRALPTLGGASPKREMFEVRAAGAGPPSPARGSAGACAPQPPCPAPRRARLGKAMARQSLTRDDTAALLATPRRAPDDDDVLAVSPPACGPIDLSSSDERSPPLLDVKKENDGPTLAAPRKTDAQALKEHNCAAGLADVPPPDATKPAKRRHSRPKLEIDMKDVQLEESCKTNGIGEHVKLQKRRKVSGDQTEAPRVETVTKETKKKSPQAGKRTPKTPASEKKSQKRKIESCANASKPKKLLLDSIDPRLKNVAALPENMQAAKTKCKTAPVVLDNLLRKNSINRDSSSTLLEKNPAELFLTPKDLQIGDKVPNINNNIVDNSTSARDGCPGIASVNSQILKQKLQNKNTCKLGKVDSKITLNSKALLRTPVEEPIAVEDSNISDKCNSPDQNNRLICLDKSDTHASENRKNKCDISNDERDDSINIKVEDITKTPKAKLKPAPNKSEVIPIVNKIEEPAIVQKPVDAITATLLDSTKIKEDIVTEQKPVFKRNKLTDKTNGEIKGKMVEKLVKLLASKRAAKLEESLVTPKPDPDSTDATKKRCKLVDKSAKSEKIEKVGKLLVSKKCAIKTDEATTVIEEACESPVPAARRRRRRSGPAPRRRRAPPPPPPPPAAPRAAPRWSNGWRWEGEPYLSKVYLNNDSRLDRAARCYPRMGHAGGDVVARGDAVLLRAGAARAQPFVARVARLWENSHDGEMMVSLVWYYRPEHTERGRTDEDAPDEVYASKHRDANSVACIEDKCYVLTFNEYCRYRKRLKAAEEGINVQPSIVPPMPASEVTPAIAPNDSKLPPSVSPELVLFCRKIYDFRSKKLQMPNK